MYSEYELRKITCTLHFTMEGFSWWMLTIWPSYILNPFSITSSMLYSCESIYSKYFRSYSTVHCASLHSKKVTLVLLKKLLRINETVHKKWPMSIFSRINTTNQTFYQVGKILLFIGVLNSNADRINRLRINSQCYSY